MLMPLHPKAVFNYGAGVGDRGEGVPTLLAPRGHVASLGDSLSCPKVAGGMGVDILLASSG